MKEKRIWCYIQKPNEHDIQCPECKGVNLEWSEFESHIWCYDCEEDYSNYISVLSGPYAVMAGHLLGIRLDRINLETKQIEVYNIETNKYENYETIRNK